MNTYMLVSLTFYFDVMLAIVLVTYLTPAPKAELAADFNKMEKKLASELARS